MCVLRPLPASAVPSPRLLEPAAGRTGAGCQRRRGVPASPPPRCCSISWQVLGSRARRWRAHWPSITGHPSRGSELTKFPPRAPRPRRMMPRPRSSWRAPGGALKSVGVAPQLTKEGGQRMIRLQSALIPAAARVGGSADAALEGMLPSHATGQMLHGSHSCSSHAGLAPALDSTDNSSQAVQGQAQPSDLQTVEESEQQHTELGKALDEYTPEM